MMRGGIFLVAVFAALLFPAAAQAHNDVTAALVCGTHQALQEGRGNRWHIEKCERVAYAFNATPWPMRVFSITIIESDLNDKAVSKPVRVMTPAGPRKAVDVGLLGIRCILSKGGLLCENLEVTDAEGHKHRVLLVDLFVPEINIALGTRIIREKVRACGVQWANCYNGNPSGSKNYGGQITAVSAALGGFRVKGGTARIREITRRIVAVVFSLRRS